MYTYTNRTEQDLVLPGVGLIKAGESFKSNRKIENPNLSIEGSADNDTVIGVQAPQENMISEATLIEPAETNTTIEESK